MGLLDVDDEELGETTPLVLEKVDTINDLQEGGSLLRTVGEKGEDRNRYMRKGGSYMCVVSAVKC